VLDRLVRCDDRGSSARSSPGESPKTTVGSKGGRPRGKRLEERGPGWRDRTANPLRRELWNQHGWFGEGIRVGHGGRYLLDLKGGAGQACSRRPRSGSPAAVSLGNLARPCRSLRAVRLGGNVMLVAVALDGRKLSYCG
jgi:hypothetical protein